MLDLPTACVSMELRMQQKIVGIFHFRSRTKNSSTVTDYRACRTTRQLGQTIWWWLDTEKNC